GGISMLGEQIGELQGKRILRRVLSTDPLKVEVTFEDSGKLLGFEVNDFGTYTSQLRPDGMVYGDGEGAFTTMDGEPGTWKGSGLGRIKEGGALSYRGILYFRTTSQKLARLNTTAVVFEYEVDPKGQTHTKMWEWK